MIIEESEIIDEKLNEKIGKTGRLYNILRTTYLGKKEVPKEIKAQVYQRVVRPVLVYGSES